MRHSFWLRSRLLRVALASSVTSSLSTTTQFSASRYVASSAYPHPASSLRSPTACASCHLSVQALRGAFASAGVDMSDDAWATTFANHLPRCGGDPSVHTAHSWLVTALAAIMSEVRGALGSRGWRQSSYRSHDVSSTPQRQRRPPRGCGCLALSRHSRLKLALDDVLFGLFGVSSPPSPEVALRHAQKTKFEKYSEEVRSRPDIRVIPFAVTEVGTLGGHATGFFTELAKQAPAS
jgi:hypothetical protein